MPFVTCLSRGLQSSKSDLKKVEPCPLSDLAFQHPHIKV